MLHKLHSNFNILPFFLITFRPDKIGLERIIFEIFHFAFRQKYER